MPTYLLPAILVSLVAFTILNMALPKVPFRKLMGFGALLTTLCLACSYIYFEYYRYVHLVRIAQDTGLTAVVLRSEGTKPFEFYKFTGPSHKPVAELVTSLNTLEYLRMIETFVAHEEKLPVFLKDSDLTPQAYSKLPPPT